MYYWRYGYEKVYSEVLQTLIGSSISVDSSYIETHDDDNCIYVAWAGNDANAGTQAAPVRTIEQAITLMEADPSAIDIITILDSNEYDTDVTGTHYVDIDGWTLQGAAGQSPTLVVDTSTQNYIVKLSYSGKLINVKMTVEDSGNQITPIELSSGTVKNVTTTGATREGISVPAGAATVVIQNCEITGCVNAGTTDGNAVKIAEGTVSIERCLFSDNYRAGIYCTGAGGKTIDIDYCTIAGNQYGVHAYGSTNCSIEITNSIVFENDIVDYYHSSVTASDCCIGTLSGLSNFSRIVVNPMFVGNSDYRIRTLHNGYTDGSYTSPVLNMSDTGKDLGAYDYVRSTDSESFSEFSTHVPHVYREQDRAIDAQLRYTNTLVPKQTDKGIITTLYLEWSNGIKVDELAEIRDMYETGGEIYLSTDDGSNYSPYKIDKTVPLEYSRRVNKDEITYNDSVGIMLIA